MKGTCGKEVNKRSYLGAGETVGDLDGRFVEMLSILAKRRRAGPTSCC